MRIGDPLDEATLMGPLVDRDAVETMQAALLSVKKQGGRVIYGGDVLSGDRCGAGTYVTPAICEVGPNLPIVREETFAPILYLMRYKGLPEADPDAQQRSPGALVVHLYQ